MNSSQNQSIARHSSSTKNTPSRGQGRNGFGNYDTTSRPHSYHARDTPDSISARISPPPLMRQRTEPKVPETDAESSRSKSLSNDHSQLRRDAQHSLFSGEISASENEQVRRERSSESLRQSFAFLKPLLQQEHGQRKHSIGSIDSDGARSGSSTRTDSLSKRKCRLCEKALATSYNPIITCLGCNRPYHDSCRRPPLIDGVDPNRWRCSKCLAGSQHRVSSGFDAPKQNSGLLSATGFLSRDMTGLNEYTARQKSLHVQPVKERKDGTSQATTARGTTSGHSDIISRAALNCEETPASCESHDPGRKLDLAKKIQHPASLAYSSRRPGSKVHEPHEVPNTLAQLSCAPVISDIISQQQPPLCTNVVDSDDDTLLSRHIRAGKVAVLTMLCSDCRRQRILVNSGDSSVKCLNCRKKDVVSAAEKSEVPEMPEVASPRKGHSQTGLQTTSSKSIATTPLSVQPAPSSWFRSRHLTSKSTIVQKSVFDRDTSPTSMGSPITPVELDTPETVFDDSTEDQDQEGDRSSTNIDNKGLPIATSGSKQLQRTKSTPNGVLVTTKSIATASEDAGSACLVPPGSNRRYTNRELARIALVAADRPQMTATEIIDLLAHSFNYLKKGHGGWEKSTKAALSQYPEFLGKKVHGERMLYSFVDRETKAQYEQLYPEYCASSGSFATRSRTRGVGVVSEKGERMVRKTIKEQRPFPIRAIKSAPTHTLKISSNSKLGHFPTIKAPTKTVQEDASLFMPFERRTTRQTPNLLDIAHEVTRESDFYNIKLRHHASSVDRMSQAEKDKKIADIKARPSRKSFFGPDHVLAHARRYGRLDIHDESEGAWQPKRPNRMDDASKLNGELSLKELFNLPENAIPMNDGPNELAFRDGTLINGKLPRPRQIYRVGRLVGTELTVRTS